MPKMTRPPISPILDAVIACLEANIDVDEGGGEIVEVGDGEAPGCPPPYLVVSYISTPEGSGPMDDHEADVNDRVQITGVGETRYQADWIRDKAREVMSTAQIDNEVDANVSRKVIRVVIDLTGSTREDRGLPEPVFRAWDQYRIMSTPA